MKLFAVIVTADYEFVGGGSSGGYEKTIVGLALSADEEAAKETILGQLKPLTDRSLSAGKYSNLQLKGVEEIPLDKDTFLGIVSLP
jgi:hypothetical protein